MSSDTVLAVGAICTAVVAIAIVARAIYRFLKRVDAFLSDWNGEPERPGRKRVPSMPERVSAVETRLSAVEGKIHG